MSPRRRRALAALVVVVATVLPLTAAEAVLRSTSRVVRPVSSGWGWEQSPLRGAVPPDRPEHTNQLGSRGQTIRYGDDDFVVLLLGDSQVEAATQPLADMPERVLERQLRRAADRPVRVFSIGSSGWSQDQQLLGLREYLRRWRADAVVVWLTPRNDPWENAFHDRSTGRDVGPIKPTFRLSGGRLVGPDRAEGFLTGTALGQIGLSAILRRSPERIIRDRHDAGLPSATRPLVGDACPGTEAYPQGRFYDLTNRLDTTMRYTVLLDPADELPEESRSHFSPMAEPRSDRDAYLEALTTALLRQIQREASVAGAESVVFAPVVDALVARDELIACLLSGEGHIFLPGPSQRDLVRRLVDPPSLVAPTVSGGAELMTAPGDNHFGRLGNERAMRALAEELVARGIVPRG